MGIAGITNKWLWLVLVLCASFVQAQSTPDFSRSRKYRVVRVSDGDTVTIGTTRKSIKIRLLGIDSPESADPFRPPQPFGKEASDNLHKLLDGQQVYVRYGSRQDDPHCRKLGYLWRVSDKTFINLRQLQDGYARTTPKYKTLYDKEFIAAEAEAKQARRGLWATQ